MLVDETQIRQSINRAGRGRPELFASDFDRSFKFELSQPEYIRTSIFVKTKTGRPKAGTSWTAGCACADWLFG